jgi:hypothetical protein
LEVNSCPGQLRIETDPLGYHSRRA